MVKASAAYVTRGGEVYTWGENRYGMLGYGDEKKDQ